MDAEASEMLIEEACQRRLCMSPDWQAGAGR